MIKINKNIFDLSLSSVLLLLALLVGLNVLVAQKYIYSDLTQEKIYTTSDATKNILKNLDKNVNVTFYISKDLPVDFLGVKTQLMDLMNQYQDIAGTKLLISYKNPDNSEEKVKELAKKGIPQIQFNIRKKNKAEVWRGFFGAEISSGKGDSLTSEALPVIQSVADIEYDFISDVYSVSRKNKEEIAFLEGQGEKKNQFDDLEKNYNISSVKIQTTGDKKSFYYEKTAEGGDGKKEQVFITPKTLLIIGPSSEITADEIDVINKYVKKGGNLIVLADAVKVNNNFSAVPLKNNLNDLIKNYGIKINEDLVYDQYNTNIPYSNGNYTVFSPYPYWVRAQKRNFGDSSSLSSLQSLVFPWVSSMSIKDNENYTVKTLISSSSKADLVSKTFNLMPDVSLQYTKMSKKIIGAFSQPKPNKDGSQGGLVYVIADSDFITPYFVKNFPDNKTFFMNLVDSISNSVNLSSIRSKTITDRPIKKLNDSEINFWKFVSIFAVALSIDIYGLIRIIKRKKANK